jgi:transposase
LKLQAYSQDLRERVLRALDRGDRPTEIALRFEVSRVWVYQVRARVEQTGERRGLKSAGQRPSLLAEKEAALRVWIAAEPDLTLADLQHRLKLQGVSIKVGALWYQLNKWGLTLKKNAARRRASARRLTGNAARVE